MIIYKRYKNKWKVRKELINGRTGNLYIGNNVDTEIDGIIGNIHIGDNTKIETPYLLEGGSVIGSNCLIKENIDLSENCIIKNNCKIGKLAHIEKYVNIGSHCYIGDYVTIYRFAKLGDHVYVAKGAAIAPGAEIPAYSNVYNIRIGTGYTLSIYYNSYVHKIEFTLNSRESSYYDINTINIVTKVESIKLKEIVNRLKERYKL